LDPRLKERYRQMVEEHAGPAQRLAEGLRSFPSGKTAFAATMGAYRFLNNDAVALPHLVEPLLAAGRDSVAEHCERMALVVHDWSKLNFYRHRRKAKRLPSDRSGWPEGYEIFSTLVVSDREGAPLAPVGLCLEAADGMHCTRSYVPRPPLSRLDEVTAAMQALQGQLPKPALHIIDAEADSLAHYRRWHSQGLVFLVRCVDRLVKVGERRQKCSAWQGELHLQKAFRPVRNVEYHGKKAEQWIAELPVTLTGPGYVNRPTQKKKTAISGEPLDLRLIIAEVRDDAGTVLATWYLLTNLPQEIDAATVALWYYWRWNIESFFKLLKSAGMDVEEWRQTTPAAIARRLLVASMACVLVWQLAASHTPPAEEMKQLLVRLSGRQMRHGKPFTKPALLAGMWVLLAMLHTLEHYTPHELHRLAELTLPFLRAGPIRR
jgi:hypothetical protein